MKNFWKYRGIKITYNEDNDKFEAKIKDSEKSEGTFTNIKNKIDKVLDVEEKIKFDKVEAYCSSIEDDKYIKCTITSYVAKETWNGEKIFARIVYGDKKWTLIEEDKLFYVNSKNTKNIEKIREIQKEIEKLNSKITKLNYSLEKVVIPDEALELLNN